MFPFSKYKIGIVLSGSGAKGSYQIGVLKALKEFNLLNKIYAISGTSAGAINVALLMQDNLDLAENIWLSINKKIVFDFKYANLKQGGIFSQDGIKSLMNSQLIDYKKNI